MEHAADKSEACAEFRGFAGKRRFVFAGAASIAAEDNAAENRWQKCHAPQKDKFFFKLTEESKAISDEEFLRLLLSSG